MPVLKLGDVVPNFDAETTEGKMNFHSWLGGKYFDFTKKILLIAIFFYFTNFSNRFLGNFV